MKLLRLDIEAGAYKVRRGRFLLPDGLHIWVGNYGVHLFWSRSKHMRRVTFDRIEPRR